MRFNKCVFVLSVCILFFVPLLVQPTVESGPIIDKLRAGIIWRPGLWTGTEDWLEDRKNFGDFILLPFYWSHYSIGRPWTYFAFMVPEIWYADKEVVDIKYLEPTEVTLGIPDPEDPEKFKSNEWDIAPGESAFVAEITTFKLEFPEGIREDQFRYTFSPSKIEKEVGGKEEMKTTLTIFSEVPLEQLPEEGIPVTVNVTKYLTFGNLLLVPGLTFLSITQGWWRYSGTTGPDPPFNVTILLKVDRLHYAEIVPPEPIEINPDQLISVPITIKNLGSHTDSFNFKVDITTGDELLVISAPNSLTLESGEEKQTSITIASPRVFQDPGTIHSIKIEAYSIYEPENVFSNTVTLVSRGVYVSPIVLMYSGFFLILVILFVAFIFFRRRRISSKFFKKPERPWNLPEEKKHLDTLKEKNKEEYNKVFKMMEDEYASSLLWYKYYAKAMKAKKLPKINIKQSFEKLLNVFRLPEKKITEKPKPSKKLLFKEKKPKELPKVEKVKPVEVKEEEKREIPFVDRKAELEKRRKEQILLKIKREQEKQKRKMKKLSY